MTTESEDLGAIGDGARLVGMMPYLNAELEAMERSLFTKILASIKDKTLTPDTAFAAWLEFASFRALSHRMQTRTKLGMAAGERQTQTLEGVNNGR